METILIIDDDEGYRSSLCIFFNKHYNILQAGSRNTAIKIIRDQRPDIVLTDGVFFHFDNEALKAFYGNDVVRECKKLNIPVIGMSSEVDKFTDLETVFAKPIDLLQVNEKIKNKLEAN